jgi:hypothetical protein
MTIDRRRCAVCNGQKDIDRTSALGVVYAGIQAAMEGDSDGAASLYEHLTPLDAHMAIAVATNVLLEICLQRGADPLATVQAMRANLASYVAKQ